MAVSRGLFSTRSDLRRLDTTLEHATENTKTRLWKPAFVPGTMDKAIVLPASMHFVSFRDMLLDYKTVDRLLEIRSSSQTRQLTDSNRPTGSISHQSQSTHTAENGHTRPQLHSRCLAKHQLALSPAAEAAPRPSSEHALAVRCFARRTGSRRVTIARTSLELASWRRRRTLRALSVTRRRLAKGCIGSRP